MRHFKVSIVWILLTLSECYHCGIAASKCREYGKTVYVEKESPIMMRTARKDLESQCGIESVPLIIGGSRSSDKEFPHMVVIGFGASPTSKLFWHCGGSLISDRFVLTAAHCLKSRELGLAQLVKLGITDLEDTDELQERRIVERIAHPQYSRFTKSNDIALLKMDEPVEFTAYVRPACLHTNEIHPGIKAIATGFGKIHYDDDDGSSQLMKVALDVYDSNKCRDIVKNLNSVICAGELNGGKDTCQGDSGGPLQIALTDPYCMYSIIGVTSFGKFCAFPNSPGVYSKVSSSVPWIESIVWK